MQDADRTRKGRTKLAASLAESLRRDSASRLPSRRLWISSPTLILVVAAALLGSGVPLLFRSRPPLWASNSTKASASPDWNAIPFDHLPRTVTRLIALDMHGLPELVAGLHHPRPEVRDSVEDAIQLQLQQWQQDAPRDAARRLARLASLLAARSEATDADALSRSAQLALTILRSFPPSSAWADDGVPLTDSCEQVINRARRAGVLAGSSPTSLEPVSDANRDEENEGRPFLPTAVDDGTPHNDVEVTGKALSRDSAGVSHGGGATIDTFGGAATLVSQPRHVREPLPAASTDGEGTPPAIHPTADSTFQPTADSTLSPTADGTFQPTADSTLSPATQPLLNQAMDRAARTDGELIRWLATEASRALAAQELARRGFSPRDIEIATSAVDPDAKRRERLASILPQLAGVDARPWLLFLSQDESPHVRAAAVRWLTTSNDPQIQARLRELANRESDESVRSMLK